MLIPKLLSPLIFTIVEGGIIILILLLQELRVWEMTWIAPGQIVGGGVKIQTQVFEFHDQGSFCLFMLMKSQALEIKDEYGTVPAL